MLPDVSILQAKSGDGKQMSEEERIRAKKAQIETLKKVINQIKDDTDDSDDESSDDDSSSSSEESSSSDEAGEEEKEDVTSSDGDGGMSKIIHAVAAKVT